MVACLPQNLGTLFYFCLDEFDLQRLFGITLGTNQPVVPCEPVSPVCMVIPHDLFLLDERGVDWCGGTHDASRFGDGFGRDLAGRCTKVPASGSFNVKFSSLTFSAGGVAKHTGTIRFSVVFRVQSWTGCENQRRGRCTGQNYATSYASRLDGGVP